MSPREHDLIERRILSVNDLTGYTPPNARQMLETRPNRRAVFRLTGLYYPEEHAQLILRDIMTRPGDPASSSIRRQVASLPRRRIHPYDDAA